MNEDDNRYEGCAVSGVTIAICVIVAIFVIWLVK